MSEIYKPIIGYEEYYEISNFGNVKRLDRIIPHINNSKRQFKERLLKSRYSGRKYLTVTLCLDRCKHFKIHRLVAIHFIPNPNNLPQVNHKDGNKLNNHVDNLEWVSNRENKNHFFLNTLNFKKYPGISYYEKRNKWRARIRIGNNRLELGYFEKEEDAAKAYVDAQLKYNIIDKYSNYED